jgi:ribokinase
MARQRVLVIGSLNMDLIAPVDRLPGPGETVTGGALLRAAGGKGANQAVAAARLGAAVSLVGRVGRDAFGRELVQGLRREGVWTRWVRVTEAATGVALITVDARGENSIIVAPGANAALLSEDVPSTALARADVVVTQLEVPLRTVEHALRAARAAGIRTILNAAPAGPVPPGASALADVLILNEHELARLAGLEAVPAGAEADVARTLRARADQVVVVTLGERGALAVAGEAMHTQPTFPVRAVDSVGAGDAFVGAFACRYTVPAALPDALAFACAAGALATTRPGAQPSLPHGPEVEALVARGPQALGTALLSEPAAR